MANAFARALRKRMTPEETRLWAHLRAWRTTRGYHFRRQAPLSGYIVDFACVRRNLVIEVDGLQHDTPEHRAADALRDADLARLGFRVLRLPNAYVKYNFESAMDTVLATLEGRC